MALLKKKTNKVTASKPYDQSNDIKKLKMFVTIVNRGQANSIIHLFEELGISAQFVQSGNGTATKSIADILGIEDNRKDIIISLVKEDNVEDIKKELQAFFVASRKNRGISFSIPMTSIIGVKVYQFLSDSL